MAKLVLEAVGPLEGCDWIGNNAAFTCPPCGKVYIVSGQLHPQGRKCPKCGNSTGFVVGGKQSGGSAYVEYDNLN